MTRKLTNEHISRVERNEALDFLAPYNIHYSSQSKKGHIRVPFMIQKKLFIRVHARSIRNPSYRTGADYRRCRFYHSSP